MLLAGPINEYKHSFELPNMAAHTEFEYFATHVAFGHEYLTDEDISDYMAGDGTIGVDSALIVINGQPVNTLSDAQELIAASKTLDVSFHFLQAKTSISYNRDLVLGFMDAIEGFIDGRQSILSHPFWAKLRDIFTEIYAASAKFRSGAPELRIYFAFQGTPPFNDSLYKDTIRTFETGIENRAMFRSAHTNVLGASQLLRLYNATVNKVEATVSFPRQTPLPRIPGIEQAYIGAIAGTELIKMLATDAGSLRKSAFFDNVRDFQQWNPVNEEMYSTLDSDKRGLFAVLNNGVTVVAKEVRIAGDDFTIEDYQIVNGCQTSNVLFFARELDLSSVYIPLRLIVTNDADTTAKITLATNSQTPITKEDLIASTDFQKELETFYKSMASARSKQRLYYERRSGQFAEESVEQTRVVTKLIQMKAFAAMFLDVPHISSRFPGELYELSPEKIFRSGHKLESYFASALSWYRLDVWLRTGRIDSSLKPSRFVMMNVFRRVALPDMQPGDLSTKSATTYANKLIEILSDDVVSLQYFEKAAAIVRTASAGDPSRDRVKREKLLQDCIALIEADAREMAAAE